MKKKILLLHNISNNIKNQKIKKPKTPLKKRKMQHITIKRIIEINNSETFNNEELKKELFYDDCKNYSDSYGQSSGSGFCR